MKKLNKKGFTLVELLAVIVILAVIMVITIPTVLGSMGDAKDKAFESAVAAVQKYIDDQVELCGAGLGSLASHNNSVFSDGSCTVNVDEAIKAAGYTGQMTNVENDGKKITYAEGAGEFAGQTFGTKSGS